MRNLSALQLKKVTHDFLENLLCEMYRHFSPATQQKLAKLKGDEFVQLLKKELSSEMFYQRVRNAQLSSRNDLYFKDVATGNWQHLFRLSPKNELQMRPSTVSNTVLGTCILRLKLFINTEGLFRTEIISRGRQEDLSDYFLKS